LCSWRNIPIEVTIMTGLKAERAGRWARTLIGIGAIFVGAAVFGLIVTLLWNSLIPPLFGLREITFWQAVGLLVLVRILVGSYGDKRQLTPKRKIPSVQ
jgi:hypothetical protein